MVAEVKARQSYFISTEAFITEYESPDEVIYIARLPLRINHNIHQYKLP